MSLVSQFEEVKDSVITAIETLIENGLGIQHPDYDDTVLDLRCFRVQGRLDAYNLEVLFTDKYSVEFISAEYAYNENGDRRSISDVFDDSLEELCQALDVLSEQGYPQYNIVLRAIVNVSDDVLPENFDFAEDWEVYDNENNDGELKIRLDTVVTVGATSKEAAVEAATGNPPSLGLEDIDSCDLDIEFWVDTDQADNIELIVD